jgi:hypothetical protein
MVKFQPSKLAMRVRFPLPAVYLFIGITRTSEEAFRLFSSGTPNFLAPAAQLF